MKKLFCIFIMTIIASSYVQADKYIFMHGPQQFLFDVSDREKPELTVLHTVRQQFNSQEELDAFEISTPIYPNSQRSIFLKSTRVLSLPPMSELFIRKRMHRLTKVKREY